ncbi:type II CAAX prenyl endopeptidase Rce1 family protein [candidate division KSB1 bacterium]
MTELTQTDNGHTDIPEDNGTGTSEQKDIFSIKESFFVLLFTAGFVFFLTIVFLIISVYHPMSVEFLLIELFFIVPAVVYARIAGYQFKKLFRFNPVSVQVLFVSIVLGFSTILIVNFIENWMSAMPQPEWIVEYKEQLGAQMIETLLIRNAYDLIILGLSIVIAAGICEEMLFRGMLQQSLEKRCSPGFAVVVTAFLFSILHPFSLIPILILAIILGILGLRSNSIYPAVVVHALNNGFSLYSLNTSQTLQNNPDQGIDVPVYVFIISAAVFVVSLRMFLQLTKKDRLTAIEAHTH